MINQVHFDDSKNLWNEAFSKNSIQAPFLTWQWHHKWFQSLGASYSPLCFTIDNEIVASFAAKDSELIFSGGDEIADYLDIIGPDEKKKSAWEQIIPTLKALSLQKITLRNIPENSVTRTFFSSLPNTQVEQEDTTPQFRLPATWETYTESLTKKYRHELERKIRKFDREHPDSEIIESTNPSQDISILFDLMEKDEAKKIFLSPEMKTFFTNIAATFTKHTLLRYIQTGDKKIAATLTFIMNNTHYLYNSGFDKECCSIAGFYLKSMNIKDAIEKRAETYNFLQGNERYKYELSGLDFHVYTATIDL